MAKRRLTKQQRERIRAIQARRKSRVEERCAEEADKLADTMLGAEQRGTIIAHYGKAIAVEDDKKQLHRCQMRQNMESLVVGDRIVWQASEQGDGVVTALLPRDSLLSRPVSSGEVKPVAANIDQIVVVIATAPEPSEGLLDRYLVAAELSEIHPIILVNKIDLLNSNELVALKERLSIYKNIGYELRFASTHSEHGLDELNSQLEGKTSVLVGQSGVGKSSLVKAIMPDLDIRIGAISEQSGLGRHTTTTSMFYHLPQSGALIDSPGVRDFSLWESDPTRIIHGFPEFSPYLGHCRFNNCSHIVEPGCALKEAIEDKRINEARLKSFHAICAGGDK
ncbi:hypothetical protein BOW53_08540 [Solemya pervernicosa gill symbiont]|uniref:Small ribosomal subunit biogenesis GTPase RsgA n=2 Tax=Gammaproteobacteria incertae sedis TaxID=118884 RepID=A0A1T2L520_9GAMM|nr:small ribosomal subunit biogenesis GTPase RsgA [Candidatus Reidiella endopervernicosa]OOZ40208.1 hypothetical protein BOW53_08540 [Solemya pervernicosa gill symbiont]QKQ27136.1 small ribosomal subunit biogenesis GTPase RsgA [Candidatus Reidiella endopervernicosa]